MVTASADAPLIPIDLVSRLAATISPGRCEIAMASSAGKLHPVIALWPVARADDLQEALAGGTRKVLNWTDKHVVHEVPFEPRVLGTTEVDPFFNANTPEDLERLDTLVLSGTR
jgi:molybdopterin-guanine dinucleotide biosynthesis protein A